MLRSTFALQVWVFLLSLPSMAAPHEVQLRLVSPTHVIAPKGSVLFKKPRFKEVSSQANPTALSIKLPGLHQWGTYWIPSKGGWAHLDYKKQRFIYGKTPHFIDVQGSKLSAYIEKNQSRLSFCVMEEDQILLRQALPPQTDRKDHPPSLYVMEEEGKPLGWAILAKNTLLLFWPAKNGTSYKVNHVKLPIANKQSKPISTFCFYDEQEHSLGVWTHHTPLKAFPSFAMPCLHKIMLNDPAQVTLQHLPPLKDWPNRLQKIWSPRVILATSLFHNNTQLTQEIMATYPSILKIHSQKESLEIKALHALLPEQTFEPNNQPQHKVLVFAS